VDDRAREAARDGSRAEPGPPDGSAAHDPAHCVAFPFTLLEPGLHPVGGRPSLEADDTKVTSL